jgi:HAE1 family hydrophobic/amphiphilic exporter-1
MVSFKVHRLKATAPVKPSPGAIGNRTIGTAAVGGMLVGTVIGVLVIPGLYYVFDLIADKRSLIKDESDEPLSEIFEHTAEHDKEKEYALQS